jgi:hypothetical protein
MNTHSYRANTIINEDGKLLLQDIPFQAGEAVEIMICRRPPSDPESDYLASVAATLTEWDSDADDAAYSNL